MRAVFIRGYGGSARAEAGAGRGSRRFAPGTPVFGMQTASGGFGAYAEYVAIDEDALAEKPMALTHEQAAAIPCTGLTAYQALVGIGRVGQGTNVTILGASGGVGSYAVQIAKVPGAEVVGVTSTANVELVRADGAQLATLAGWIAARRMMSLIDSAYPLAEAKAALEKSRTFRSRGKLVLRVKDLERCVRQPSAPAAAPRQRKPGRPG